MRFLNLPNGKNVGFHDDVMVILPTNGGKEMEIYSWVLMMMLWWIFYGDFFMVFKQQIWGYEWNILPSGNLT